MTTDDVDAGAKIVRMNANIAKIEALSARLMQAVSHRKPHDAALDGPAQQLYVKAATAYVTEMMANPTRMMEQQVNYWSQTLKHYVAAQTTSVAKESAPTEPAPKDSRVDRKSVV